MCLLIGKVKLHTYLWMKGRLYNQGCSHQGQLLTSSIFLLKFLEVTQGSESWGESQSKENTGEEAICWPLLPSTSPSLFTLAWLVHPEACACLPSLFHFSPILKNVLSNCAAPTMGTALIMGKEWNETATFKHTWISLQHHLLVFPRCVTVCVRLYE